MTSYSFRRSGERHGYATAATENKQANHAPAETQTRQNNRKRARGVNDDRDRYERGAATVKPPRFEYHRPEAVEDALQIMAEHRDQAKPLAGGQSLVPLLATRQARPSHIVDLQRVAELRQISVADGYLRFGAMTRHRDIERDPRMPGLVKAAVPHIGPFQIRNRGTVGGSLSHMDPAAEWPALALVLSAVMVAASARGRREIAADDFMIGPQMTALAPDELLVEVVVPIHHEGFGFAEVTRRGRGDFALVGAACQGTAVAVFGTGARPQRLSAVEEFLESGGGTRADVSALAASEIQATGDIRASSDYRREVAATLVGTVVEASETSRAGFAWS